MLSFEEIEDCFPNGAVSLPDGWIGVTAQWMHDLARAIEAAVLDEKQEPVKDEPVAYLACMYRSVIEGKAENIPLGATISFINMGWKNQIELYIHPQPDLTAEVEFMQGKYEEMLEEWLPQKQRIAALEEAAQQARDAFEQHDGNYKLSKASGAVVEAAIAKLDGVLGDAEADSRPD